MATTKEYTATVLETKETETIRAQSIVTAKKQMAKKHGPEYDENNMPRWVIGLSPAQFDAAHSG